MGLKDKLMNLGRQHGDKVEQGIDRAGESAKERLGHEQQVDQAAEQAKERFRDEPEEPPGPPPQR